MKDDFPIWERFDVGVRKLTSTYTHWVSYSCSVSYRINLTIFYSVDELFLRRIISNV